VEPGLGIIWAPLPATNPLCVQGRIYPTTPQQTPAGHIKRELYFHPGSPRNDVRNTTGRHRLCSPSKPLMRMRSALSCSKHTWQPRAVRFPFLPRAAERFVASGHLLLLLVRSCPWQPVGLGLSNPSVFPLLPALRACCGATEKMAIGLEERRGENGEI